MSTVKLFILIVAALSLNACTTQKAVKETKRQFDNGEYGWAIYTGTVGVTMAALVDVFTLGGTTDAETGYNTISDAANHNGNKSPTLNSSATSTSGASMILAANPSTTTPATSGVTQTAQAGASQTSAAKQTGKAYADAGHCITRDSASNSLADFWVNSCNFPVVVMWYDAKYCDTGCMTGVKASGRESITKGVPGSSYNYAVCPKPATPRGPDRIKQWKNEGVHYCYF